MTNNETYSKTNRLTHLTQRDDEATQCLFLAGEADVVGGDKHLSQDVHLVKGGPQGTVGVSIQFFIFGQTEECPVTFTFRSRIQVPKGCTMLLDESAIGTDL